MAASEPRLVDTLRRLRDDLLARLTRDVDVAVATTDDADAEAIVRRMLGAGYTVTSTVEQTKTGRLATARLERAGVIVDLLFATCGIENEIVRAADELELVPRLVMPVARTGHLNIELGERKRWPAAARLARVSPCAR